MWWNRGGDAAALENDSTLPPTNKRFTVLMVAHNRMEYLRTILYYLRPENEFLCDRDEFLLVDYLSSDDDILLPSQLKGPQFQVDGGEAMRKSPHLFQSDLSIMENSCVKLLRKQQNWTHDDVIYKFFPFVKDLPTLSTWEPYPNEPKGDDLPTHDILFSEKPKYHIFTERNHNKLFSMWKAWRFALRHIHSERIFYFDNCNRPTKYLHYTIFMNPDRGYYFPNVHRYYNQNFSLERRNFLRFLLELPGHFLLDKRSFFGVDQLFPWYFASERSMPKFHHVPHITLSNYEKYYPHVAVQWRIFLWLNYYGTPARYYSEDFCIGPKRILCLGDGMLLKMLRLPILFHLTDALLFFEFFVFPFVVMFNWTQHSAISVIFAVVLNSVVLGLLSCMIRWLWQRKVTTSRCKSKEE